MARAAFHVEHRLNTPADDLRDQLTQLEAQVGRLGHGLGEEELSILSLLDSATAILTALEAQGRDMRAEQARLEAVSAQLERKASTFLREIGGVGALQEARRQREPDEVHWWWFLDQIVAQRRRAWLRRLGRRATVVGVVLLALFVIYQRFLAPDPATQERIGHEQSAQALALEGDLAGALSEVEQALAIAPNDPELLILKGALHRGLGQAVAAEEAFARAETALGDREAFLLGRGEAYLLLDQAEAALGDAEAVVARNPQSAAGYLLLARVQERLGNYQPALAAYEQAATLADAQGDAPLAATARFSRGMLMQRLPAYP